MTRRTSPPPPTPPALPSWPLPRWIAHRGAGREAPENTLAACRLGASLGWGALECDVKLSADGVPFLLHDATLTRTTNGHGRANLLSWQELAQLDAGRWHSAAHTGERLPTLAEVVAHAQATGQGLNLEIKPTPGLADLTGTGVAQQLAGLIDPTRPAPAVLFSSFMPQALAAAQRVAPQWPRALLLERLSPGHVALAHKLGCIGVVLDHTLISAERVRGFHAAGLQVAAYTVNDAARAEQLLGWGVSSLISDAVRALGPGAHAEPSAAPSTER